MTITEFLEARIGEDEAAAGAATAGPWEVDAMDAGHSRYEMNVWIAAGDAGDSVCDMDGLSRSRNERVALDDGYKDAQHIARYDPARVLAECAAKRNLIEVLSAPPTEDIHAAWMSGTALRCMAAVYASHPDYRPEWGV